MKVPLLSNPQSFHNISKQPRAKVCNLRVVDGGDKRIDYYPVSKKITQIPKPIFRVNYSCLQQIEILLNIILNFVEEGKRAVSRPLNL